MYKTYMQGLVVDVFEDTWTTDEKRTADDRNYSSLADEFDAAAATATAETETVSEVILSDEAHSRDDGAGAVRRRVPTSVGDGI